MHFPPSHRSFDLPTGGGRGAREDVTFVLLLTFTIIKYIDIVIIKHNISSKAFVNYFFLGKREYQTR